MDYIESKNIDMIRGYGTKCSLYIHINLKYQQKGEEVGKQCL